MSDDGVDVREADGVISVTFDRPEKKNAISDRMTEALWDAARSLAGRDDLRVMVITGRGDYFTAGIDLGSETVRTTVAASQSGSFIEYRRRYRQHHLLYDEFESIEKPIVLAAQGHCFGAGLEMAMSCDFRLASANATFSLPEVRLGVTAGSGGTSRLTRLVGPHWAKWLAMAGQSVDAGRALSMGLVHDVVEPERLDERVRDLTHELISIPAECLGLAKLIVDISADVDRTTQRHVDRIANGPLLGSTEFTARAGRFGAAPAREGTNR